jgi:peroxisomal membrane protein 4
MAAPAAEGPCSVHADGGCVSAALRGMVHGAWYGAKVRFPHALVMALLYHRGSWPARIRSILHATAVHSKNLCLFVGLFKLSLCALRRLLGPLRQSMGPNKLLEMIPHLVAGGAAGTFVFGSSDSPVNTQINLYILSRAMYASAKVVGQRTGLDSNPKLAYSALAGCSWAVIMTLFAFEAKSLQRSLSSSMQYLYSDSDSKLYLF